MHIEISLLKEAEKVERTQKLIELGGRTAGIVSRKWPRRITCNLVEHGANLIHLNMMRSKVPMKPVILVY
jgi:hypothetical protein